jgi:hypothetical protein
MMILITLNLYPRMTQIEEMISAVKVAYRTEIVGVEKNSSPKYGKWNCG